MTKLQALVAKYLPVSALTAANAAAFGSAAAPATSAVDSRALDSFGRKSLSVSEALGLQVGTDRATLRALLASNLLAAGHRTSMHIIDNIGK